MDSEVAGSGGKRRRLWVAGGVGAVLVVGVLAGLMANGSRSGNASDIISFTCSGQMFWFDKTVMKKYGDIENKDDKLVTADFLKSKCPPGNTFTGSPEFADYVNSGHTIWWVFDTGGKTCSFLPGSKLKSFKLNDCTSTDKSREHRVLKEG